jgi:hypothetical protein
MLEQVKLVEQVNRDLFLRAFEAFSTAYYAASRGERRHRGIESGAESLR